MMLYGLLFGLALIASLCLTPPVRAVARWAGVLDVPDGRRKLHPKSVPLLGGVAVFISFYICLWLVGHAARIAVGPVGVPARVGDVRAHRSSSWLWASWTTSGRCARG